MEQTDLSTLFESAIESEIEANAFYKDAAEKVADPSVKAILEQLASEEKGHEALLRKMQSDPSLSVKFNAPQDWKVAESVEASPPLTTSLAPADAFALAMKKEQAAVEFYSRLAEWATEGELRSAYENLANMERGHKSRLEKLYVDVGFPEAF